MDNVVISVCTPEDIPSVEELLALYDAVYWTTYTRDLALLVEGIQNSQRVVIARKDGQLVGLARVLTDGATICYLQDVLVDPQVQRSGIGKALVEEVFAPYAKVRQHVLITDEDPGQKAFYEAVGFTEFGSEDRPGRTFVRLS